MPDAPHFAFPFARGSVVEQDTPEHVMACVNVIVRCPVGFREERPEFGWPWPEFRGAPLNVGELEGALAHFEPRARYSASELADVAEVAVRDVTVRVEV